VSKEERKPEVISFDLADLIIIAKALNVYAKETSDVREIKIVNGVLRKIARALRTIEKKVSTGG